MSWGFTSVEEKANILENGLARRYHWHSHSIKSFVEEPHNFIYGKNQGQILNLTDKDAFTLRNSILNIVKEKPDLIIKEIKNLKMPLRHEVKANDLDLKRLGAILSIAYEGGIQEMESLLLNKGLGPRTVQSLALVSEVIHGTPTRFSDPARFSFAHGGKDGHPFPVPSRVYDETIDFLSDVINKSKIGLNDQHKALKSLMKSAQNVEKNLIPDKNKFEAYVKKERAESYKYGGRTVFGDAKPPLDKGGQLSLFE
jgi:uncharacterized protein